MKKNVFVLVLVCLVVGVVYFVISLNFPGKKLTSGQDLSLNNCDFIDKKLLIGCFGENVELVDYKLTSNFKEGYVDLEDPESEQLTCVYGSEEVEGVLVITLNNYMNKTDAKTAFDVKKELGVLTVDEKKLGDLAFSAGGKKVILKGTNMLTLSQNVGSNYCVKDMPASLWNDIAQGILEKM